MRMERKILANLIEWKVKGARKPLLLYGARQVGKTFLVKDVFGPEQFSSVCYVNFERDGFPVYEAFELNLDPHRIVRDLSLIKGMDIVPEQTLILFDEVQLCEEAVSSLKYFAEQAPEYKVIATGSLFGVELHRSKHKLTFPVGKVDVIHMYPMDFEEFLWAYDRRRLAEGIRESYLANTRFLLHDEALRLYREYLLVGGMPEAVVRYVSGEGFDEVREAHHGLGITYTSDIARYIGDINAARTLELWESIPRQLMKENRKFRLSDIKKSARGAQYAESFTWLRAAGLIYICPLAMDGEPPFISPGQTDESFKAYLFDTGMLSSVWRVDTQALLTPDKSTQMMAMSAVARGALAENYVMQSLQANGIKPVYWKSKGSAELEFLFQDASLRGVPVEVKSGDNVRSRSLSEFRKRYDPAISLRFSTRNFGLENDIKSVPLYAAFCVGES